MFLGLTVFEKNAMLTCNKFNVAHLIFEILQCYIFPNPLIV